MDLMKRSKREKEEALFFDFEAIKQKKIYIPNKKVILDKPEKVFNYILKRDYIRANYNCVNKKSFLSKQVVIKTLSNLDKVGAKNALAYTIRNSESDFAIMDDGSYKTLKEIMDDWSKDFTTKKNAKEVLHLAFCIDETGGELTQFKLKRAVQSVMQKNFYLYKYAMVVHTHQSKPHIHVLINKNNLLDGQKFHLNNAEFKLFFNQLRNDFAQSLNSQGFQYYNHYKIEKDLKEISSEIKRDAFISKQNVLDELTKLQLSVDKRIKSKQNKLNSANAELKNLFAKRAEIFNTIKELKGQDKAHKKLWQVYKDMSEIFTLIKNKRADINLLNKELNSLRKDFNKFDYQKLVLRHDENQEFSNLIQKKKYLDFITSNLDRKTLTKSEINLKIRAIQRDINLSENLVSDMIKERIKSSLLTTQILGVENNAFHLARAYRDLSQNLENLKQFKDELDKEDFPKELEKRLENNQAVILELINQRFTLLQQEIELKKRSNKLKAYIINEYENASKFLNKDNALEIENLRKLIGISISGDSQKAKEKLEIKENSVQEHLSQENLQQNNQAKKPENSQSQTNNLQEKMRNSGFSVRR